MGIVSAMRNRLVDDDNVLVSVTYDEELADMRDDCYRGPPSASTSAYMSSTAAAGATLLVLSGKSPPPQTPPPLVVIELSTQQR